MDCTGALPRSRHIPVPAASSILSGMPHFPHILSISVMARPTYCSGTSSENS